MLIVIEGIDGSGKGTQAKLLSEKLACPLISYPMYKDTIFGGLVGRFLNGDFGALQDVHPVLASLLYANDRFESLKYLEGLLRTQKVVVSDRYIASNVGHQVAKLKGEERGQLMQFLNWLEHTLYRAITPTLTVWLDMPVEHATKLIALKNKRAYTDKAADIHESDLGYLQNVYEVYKELAEAPNWKRIQCCDNNRIRDIEDIAEEVYSVVGPLVTEARKNPDVELQAPVAAIEMAELISALSVSPHLQGIARKMCFQLENGCK